MSATEHAIYPSLAGKRVLITGGGSGIGAGLVQAFARQKAKVAFIDIAEAESRVLVGKISSEGHPAPYFHVADLRDPAALAATLARIEEQLGGFDVLVNNAANDDRHEMTTVTPEYWDERIAVNLRHLFFAAQAAAVSMKRIGGGVILNLGSISWHLGLKDLVVYQTASHVAVAEHRVGRAPLVPQTDDVLDGPAPPTFPRAAERHPLVHERGDGHAPAAPTHRARSASGMRASVKYTSLNSASPVIWYSGGPRRRVPSCPPRSRTGPCAWVAPDRCGDTSIPHRRDVGQSGPHLLPVHDPLVPVAHGPGSERATSDPAPGSENIWHQISSPVKHGRRKRCACPRCPR